MIIGHTPRTGEVRKDKLFFVHPDWCIFQVRDIFSFAASNRNVNDKYINIYILIFFILKQKGTKFELLTYVWL
jgi:hypothetical protein